MKFEDFWKRMFFFLHSSLSFTLICCMQSTFIGGGFHELQMYPQQNIVGCTILAS